MTGRQTRAAVGAVLLGSLAAAAAQVVEQPAAGGEPVVVVDSAGKEVRLTGVKVTGGVRRLGWLADPKGAGDDAKKGPLAFQLREPHSTTYAQGVVTLVPLAAIEAIRYEPDKMTVSVKGLKEPLVGSTQFRGINTLAFEGDSGGSVAKFAGGVPKGGIKSVTFPNAKPLPDRKPDRQAWSVQIVQPKAGDPTLTVRNLMVLYAYPGGAEELTDQLSVRKGGVYPLWTLNRLEVLAVDPNTQMAAAEIQAQALLPRAPWVDTVEQVVAVPLTREKDKRTGTLVGLVGEVDAGWKLFPLHAVKVTTPTKPADPPPDR
jgi:hypothetical protein